MLNGLAPIMLFNFLKTSTGAPSKLAKIPIIAQAIGSAKNILAPIPVYLDEQLTGLCIQTESKNVDIDTDTITLTTSSDDPINNQRGLSSTVTVTMKAKRGTIGIALLSVLIDVVFQKVTANEYTISYLHGDIIILGALLHSFEINENEDNELSEIKMVLINPAKQKATSVITPGSSSLITGVSGVHP